MDGICSLSEAISSIPVPAAPPRMSMDGAAVGLAFLDAALRLNHVRRLTERLTLTQHRAARRVMQVDISLRMLTDSQREAARLVQDLLSHRFGDLPDDPSAARTAWVPVTRISWKNDAGPIDVHDGATGARVPTLTQYETSRFVASGLYRLLRGILVSHPDSRDPDKPLSQILYRVHEPRWTIQAALLAILTERNMPGASLASDACKTKDRSPSDGHFRTMALNVFDDYASILGDYRELLDLAVNDYIVVAGLDAAADEHLLTFDAPLSVPGEVGGLARFRRFARASRKGYYVHYRTDMPSTLRSYHLIAEAVPGVDIDTLFLTTDANKRLVSGLESDLCVLADKLEPLATSRSWPAPSDKVLDLQVETVLGRLSELLRRRRWDASNAGVKIPQRCIAVCGELAHVVRLHENSLELEEKASKSILSFSAVSPQNLRSAAREISLGELHYDIAVDRQPASKQAHVYWRRPAPGPMDGGRTHVRAGLVLRNAAESTARAVVAYALAVATIAYSIAALIARDPWPYGTAADQRLTRLGDQEAIIAVLLLVPGFMYTRLSLPARGSIAGHLRWLPRLVMYVCIVSMAALSAAVAAASPAWVMRLAFAMASALPLGALLLILIRPTPESFARKLARLGAPPWITADECGQVKPVAPDAAFTSSGAGRE